MTSLGSTPEPDNEAQASSTAPLVSIITPCFNGEQHVSKLIESVLAQTHPNIEFILVNDGSTDGTDDIVRAYEPRLRHRLSRFVYVQQENAGLGGAIYAGLRHVTGDYVCWPDADDYLEPTSVEERVAILEARPEVGVVTSDAWIRDARDPSKVTGRVSTSFPTSHEPWQFEHLLRAGSIFAPGCHMARMSMFDETHPAREIYPARRGQNWQMLLPLYYKYERHYLDRPLYNYMVFPNSMSRGDTSPEAQIHRADEHREFKMRTLETIPMSDAERRRWERLIDELRERKVLDIAAKAGDGSLARESHRRLHELARPRGRDRVALRAKLVQAMVTRPVATEEMPQHATLQGSAGDAAGHPIETVSALVTTYNGARFIEAQLESIAQQTMPVTQVLIADDGSTDDTVGIVERFIHDKGLTGWSVVQNERNLGPALNVLTHLEGLTGDMVLLADQDDVWELDKAATLASYLQRDAGLRLVVSRTTLIDSQGHHVGDKGLRRRVGEVALPGNYVGARRLDLIDFLGSSRIPLHAMGVRGELVRTIASITHYPALSKSLGADWYIGILSAIFGRAILVPERLVRRRVHDTNISLGRLRKKSALASPNSKRILMLREAREAHLSLLREAQVENSLDPIQSGLITDMAEHLQRRINFTENPSLLQGGALLLRIEQYRRGAGSLLAGARMWVADVMYAYDINWRLRGKDADAGDG
jgi:glycosyltransferase involved in cell wall biosynthesis